MRSTVKRRGARPVQSHYVLDPRRCRPLGTERQRDLVRRYQSTHDPGLERQLIEGNMRLVLKLARDHYREGGASLEDLVQEGMLGLIQAIRRYDASKGASLSTYATYWVRAFISKFKMDNARIVRAVRTRAQRAAFYRGEVALSDVSLDAPPASTTRSLHEQMADPSLGVDELLSNAELARLAQAAVVRLRRGLPAREAIVLDERLLAERPRPYREVGARLSLSGERVRQIEGTLRAVLRDQIGGASVAAAA